MRVGPFGAYVDGFADRLIEQGYARASVRYALQLMADFGRWLRRRKMIAQRLTPEHLSRYLDHRRRRGHFRSGDAAIARRLFALLVERGVVAESPPREPTPAERLEEEFRRYLEQERQLAPATVFHYRLHVRRFLVQLAGAEAQLERLCCRCRRLVQREAARLRHPKRSQLMASALRSFLQFARYRALIEIDLRASWGQSVVVENRPGGSGVIANNLVAKAVADGHTLLLTAGTFVVSAAQNAQLPYDPFKDFTGITQISSGTAVMVVPSTLGVKSVPELISLAKERPGKVIFVSNGIASGPWLQVEQFRRAAGIRELGHVAYTGTAQSLIETATGRVHIYVSTIAPTLTFIKDGKLVPLAIYNPPRSPLLPDVPLLQDTLPGIKRMTAQGVLAPSATPRAIVNQISRDFARVLTLPEVKDQLASLGFTPLPTTPEEYDRINREQIAMIAGFLKAAGL